MTSPNLSKKQKKEIQSAYSVIWDQVETGHPGPSRVDALYLAHGFVLNLPIITDDRDMRSLAALFDIPTKKTLDLLRMMLDCQHITTEKVLSIVAHWKYNQDTPADMHIDLKSVFSELHFK